LDDSPSSFIIFFTLLALQAFLTLTYAALINTRQSELKEQAEQGRQNAKLALSLFEAKSRLSITYSLSTMLLSFAMALLLTVQIIIPILNDASQLTLPLGILVVLGIGVIVMIFGNVLPEAVGSAYAMSLTHVLVRPIMIILTLLSPLTILMLAISTLLARLFGSDQLINTVTEEEIMTLVNAGYTGGTIEDEEKAMIYSILQLDQTLSREVMVPRIDMAALEVSTPVSEALGLFIETGFSRIPVYEENVDNIVGLLYAKDILNLLNNGGLENHAVRDLVRSAYFVPETKPVDQLLRDLQARKVHMAIVVDEYGGTSGLLTIENIIEEIVGDIRDEYDQNEEYEYIQNSETEYLIDAGMDLDDVNELLDTDLSTENTDTLGGFIYLNIGRVPIVGEVIETEELTLKVRSLEGRRIRKVLVKLKPRSEEGADSSKNDETQTLADVS